MDDHFVILREHKDLLNYVDSLQRKNAEALSFYPKSVFQREQLKGRIFLGILNGEPCGYIYVGSGSRLDLKCHQVCIQYDARRKLYGASLVVAVEDFANSLGCTRITLRCGFDLAANEFWKSLGYICVQVVDGGIRRMRKINIWTKIIGPELFIPDSIEPAEGNTDASLWRKHKTTGLVTKMSRGKSLRDYRSLILET